MIGTLEQFAGNDHTLAAVKELLAGDRMPRALLVEGPEGSGRKTLARLMAAGLLCGGPSRPCGDCAVCRLVQSGGHPDVITLTPEKKKSVISVDQIRALRAEAFVRPNQGERKVFLLDGPLLEPAQNAFLKILEEPPAGVYFILIARRAEAFLDTVLSRVTVFTLGAVTWEEAARALRDAGRPADETARLRFLQNGCVIGGATDTASARTDPVQPALLCARALAEDRPADFLLAVAPLAEERGAYAGFLDALFRLLRDGLAAKYGSPAGADDPAALLARRRDTADLVRMSEAVAAARDTLLYNPNKNLFFTALCAALFQR